MTDPSAGKLDIMWKLLSDYNFLISITVPDNLKCVSCKNILRNACQVPCGCRYCRGCIDEMLAKGIKICPGSNEDCKNENLSNIQTDYVGNKEIAKLIVKCPEELCLHECELRNMNEHLRLCAKRSTKCPYSDMGCDYNEIESKKINDHLLAESYIHSKILIEHIDRMKNEIMGLKKIVEKHKFDMESMKRNLIVKEEKIDFLMEEIKLIKGENKNVELQTEKTIPEKLENKPEEAVKIEKPLALKEEPDTKSQETHPMKTDNPDAAQKMKFELKIEGSMSEIEPILDGMRQAYKENLEENPVKTKEENRKESVQKVNKKKSSLDDLALGTKFAWNISTLYDMGNQGDILSDYFFSKPDKYKMRLALEKYSNYFYVHLCIYSDENNPELKWPFEANITFKASSKGSGNTQKTITKQIKIEEPPVGSYKSSDEFKFLYSDVFPGGLDRGNCLMVECNVEII